MESNENPRISIPEKTITSVTEKTVDSCTDTFNNVLMTPEDKLSYAKSKLSEKQLEVIGDFILEDGMTIDKIDVLANGFFTINQINALGLKNVLNPLITADKMTVIGFGLSANEITEIGAEILATMKIGELNELIKKYN